MKEIFISIPVTLNRASLGESTEVFVMVKAVPFISNHFAHVPREDITVNEQPLGEEISARLKVKVVKKNTNGFLEVETKDRGEIVNWKVNKKGEIVPAKLEPVFNI